MLELSLVRAFIVVVLRLSDRPFLLVMLENFRFLDTMISAFIYIGSLARRRWVSWLSVTSRFRSIYYILYTHARNVFPDVEKVNVLGNGVKGY